MFALPPALKRKGIDEARFMCLSFRFTVDKQDCNATEGGEFSSEPRNDGKRSRDLIDRNLGSGSV